MLFVSFVAKLLSDLHRAFDQIYIFEDLEPQVVVEIGVIGEEFVYDCQSLFVSVARV